MPRFVVLEHLMPPESSHPGIHWDFMLEVEGALRTWRLEKSPAEAGTIVAEALADHRLAYLDYEGPVSGNRGIVTRHDEGNYEPLSDQSDCVVVRLLGKCLQGTASLQRDASQHQRWTFSFSRSADGSRRAAD